MGFATDREESHITKATAEKKAMMNSQTAAGVEWPFWIDEKVQYARNCGNGQRQLVIAGTGQTACFEIPMAP